MTQPYDTSFLEDEDEYEDEVRECENSCSHFDSLNLCCWLVSKDGLCRDVREGDLCLYGFKEDEDK